MRVIAKLQGFYRGERRRVGAEFEMSEADMKKDKDGKPVLPKWVVPASSESRRELADGAKVQEERDIRAVQAAAGPKRAGRTAVSVTDVGDLV